ncbi:methylhydantoinase [Pueribacillus theae]|uniref:Methylhydantoinase n=1 Tax=Pueribacillus theae TaxID=2171751 RepID=A0A2U1JWU9_9BACI|nr:hydantoinase B/oxoprolinase family protein [Pueribacillus theae]PWA09429.1 methylhydantoinase [Pueribacillus theae]
MIEAQIFYSKLQAICREMGHNLERTSRSPLLALDRSYASAILTEELELAVQKQYDVGHLYALRDSVATMFDYFSYDLAEGDIILVADPYSGGTQGQTVTMAAPLFQEGELVLFPVVRAQMMDFAGEYPGGYHPEAFEVWQEGIRVTPIKLYHRGVLQRDVWRFLLANSRAPSLLESDLKAMVACLRLAEEQIADVLGSYRPEETEAFLKHIFQYSETQVRRLISDLPEVTFQSKACLKDEKAGEVPIHVKLMKENDSLTIDFSGTGNQVETPLNSPIASTKAYAVWPFLTSFENGIDLNEGTLLPFHFNIEEGTIVSPHFPAATAFSGKITGHFISEAVVSSLRSGGLKKEIIPSIHGMGPEAVLYPPIGKEREIEPLFLVPGFPISSSGWGPSPLYGEKLLVSAEELEMHDGFQMVSRELDNGQGMTVQLVNHRADIYANLIQPVAKNEEYGSIEITGSRTASFHESALGELLKYGDQITFRYPGKGSDES